MESKTEAKEQRGDLQFPWKLHLLLEQAEETGQDHIISWLPGGRAFRIHDRKAFSEKLMVAFFSSSKFKSFQRSLNLWGFKTVSRGPEKGVRYHEHFVKGKADLCQLMIRTKVKGNNKMNPQEIASGAAPESCVSRPNHNNSANGGNPSALFGTAPTVPSGGGVTIGRPEPSGLQLQMLASQILANRQQRLPVMERNTPRTTALLHNMLLPAAGLLAVSQNRNDCSPCNNESAVVNALAAVNGSLNLPATLCMSAAHHPTNSTAIVDFVASQLLAGQRARAAGAQIRSDATLVNFAGGAVGQATGEEGGNVYVV